jgi:acetyl/propionyl-CoA carboxylase alpha subunit
MMSKLVAWGEDRPQALVRMRRALSEYRVVGVKTTIPFFQWILRQDAFRDGRFDTTYLDGILADPAAARFADPGPDAEEIAAMAAALETYFRASGTGRPRRAGAWRRAARLEGLRPS